MTYVRGEKHSPHNFLNEQKLGETLKIGRHLVDLSLFNSYYLFTGSILKELLFKWFWSNYNLDHINSDPLWYFCFH